MENGKQKPNALTAVLAALLVACFGAWAAVVANGVEELKGIRTDLREQITEMKADLVDDIDETHDGLQQLRSELRRGRIRDAERIRSLEVDVNNLREIQGLTPREHDLPEAN